MSYYVFSFGAQSRRKFSLYDTVCCMYVTKLECAYGKSVHNTFISTFPLEMKLLGELLCMSGRKYVQLHLYISVPNVSWNKLMLTRCDAVPCWCLPYS
jgi:hypothetical protein